MIVILSTGEFVSALSRAFQGSQNRPLYAFLYQIALRFVELLPLRLPFWGVIESGARSPSRSEDMHIAGAFRRIHAPVSHHHRPSRSDVCSPAPLSLTPVILASRIPFRPPPIRAHSRSFASIRGPSLIAASPLRATVFPPFLPPVANFPLAFWECFPNSPAGLP